MTDYRPGINVRRVEVPNIQGPVTDTGQSFMVGMSEKGKVGSPIKSTSRGQAVTQLGGLVAYGSLQKGVSTYFGESGGTNYASRMVGTGAVGASVTLQNSSNAAIGSLSFTDPGEFANGYVATVTNTSGSVTIVIKDAAGGQVAASPTLTSELDLVEWAESDPRLTYTDAAGTGVPKTQTVTFAGGDSNTELADNTTLVNALAAFGPELGPGHVSAPGYATVAAATALINHAAANNRFAECDAPDLTDVQALITHAQSIRAAVGANARYGRLWAPVAKLKSNVLGSVNETIGWSAIQSGIESRKLAIHTENWAAANDLGVSATASDLTVEFTADEITQLVAAGISVAIVDGGQVIAYADRTLADVATDANYYEATDSLTMMALEAKGKAALRPFLFKPIDKQGSLTAQINAALRRVAQPYFDDNALYGDTLDDACQIQVDAIPAQRRIDVDELVYLSQSAEQINYNIAQGLIAQEA